MGMEALQLHAFDVVDKKAAIVSLKSTYVQDTCLPL